jgi:hypothetical protein
VKLLVLGGTKVLGRAVVEAALARGSTEADHAAFQLVDVSRAVEAGLVFRPLAETARDVPAWTGNAGLSAEREAALLSAWQRVAA